MSESGRASSNKGIIRRDFKGFGHGSKFGEKTLGRKKATLSLSLWPSGTVRLVRAAGEGLIQRSRK